MLRPPVAVALRLTHEGVVKMDHAVCEAAFVEPLERQAHALRKEAFAAADRDRRDEQVALVDQACVDRLRGEIGTVDRT
jgi:hypothetical protein